MMPIDTSISRKAVTGLAIRRTNESIEDFHYEYEDTYVVMVYVRSIPCTVYLMVTVIWRRFGLTIDRAVLHQSR